VSLAVTRGALALAALAGAIASIAVVLRPAKLTAAPAAVRAPGESRGAEPPAKLDSIADAVALAAPFRVSRSAPGVPYDPERRNEAAAPALEAVPKPPLQLVGIVWSTRPTAVIAGVPSVTGAWVAERGDTMAGLRVRKVERERVVVSGYDTTWNLRVRELP
jgi:hypothetical protein